MNYETATDFELNSKLAELDLPCDYELKEGKVLLVNTNTYLGAHGEPYEIVEAYDEFNPCKNWNAIMPIAVELNISLVCMAGYWDCHELDDFGDERHNTSDESPQRALVICCIKVLEDSK